MSDAARLRTLLHVAACAAVTYLLLTVAGSALPLALHPLTTPARTLLLLLALAAPALPLPGGDGARTTFIAAALLLGAGALFASAPAGAAVVIAAGTVWLALSPRLLSPRAIAVGAALGAALLPLRSDAPYAVAAAAVALGVAAPLLPWRPAPTPERRARGLRLRGMIALGALLYLDSVLRLQLAAGAEPHALLATLTGSVGALFVAIAPVPEPRNRAALLVSFALGTCAALLAAWLAPGAAWPLALRALLIVFIGRTLVSAAARRRRVFASAAWVSWLAAAAVAAALGIAPAVTIALLTAFLALLLLPRPARWSELGP